MTMPSSRSRNARSARRTLRRAHASRGLAAPDPAVHAAAERSRSARPHPPRSRTSSPAPASRRDSAARCDAWGRRERSASGRARARPRVRQNTRANRNAAGTASRLSRYARPAPPSRNRRSARNPRSANSPSLKPLSPEKMPSSRPPDGDVLHPRAAIVCIDRSHRSVNVIRWE